MVKFLNGNLSWKGGISDSGGRLDIWTQQPSSTPQIHTRIAIATSLTIRPKEKYRIQSILNSIEVDTLSQYQNKTNINIYITTKKNEHKHSIQNTID